MALEIESNVFIYGGQVFKLYKIIVFKILSQFCTKTDLNGCNLILF